MLKTFEMCETDLAKLKKIHSEKRARVSTSALGQKQTSGNVGMMSALPPKADIRPRDQDICFVPKTDIELSFEQFIGSD
jgi:hypothetical protein